MDVNGRLGGLVVGWKAINIWVSNSRGLDSSFSIDYREEEMEGDMEREVGTRKEREGGKEGEGEKGRARD